MRPGQGADMASAPAAPFRAPGGRAAREDAMRLRTFTTPLAAAVAVVVLAACAAAPITHTVDLKAQMAEESTAGTVTAPIVAGEAGAVDLRLPDEDGDCIDFADVAPGATVGAAQLHWVVDATYDGPDLTGKLQARAFAAGAGREVFHPARTAGPGATLNADTTAPRPAATPGPPPPPPPTVGPVFTLNLAKPATRLAGTADLNPTQLAAINDREVCWGVEVWGEDLAAHEDGVAAIGYEVRELRLRVTFSVV